MNELINEALRTWNTCTGYWKRRITLTTSRGFPYYALPSTLTMAATVSFNGTPLVPGSVFEWDQGSPYWEGRPSTPEEWSPVGLATIAIRPPHAVGNGSLVVDGVSATPVMSSDTDGSGNPIYIDLGQEDFNAVLDYIQHIASFKEGGQEFASTERLLQSFYRAAGNRCSKFRASVLYRRVMGLDQNRTQKPRESSNDEAPIGAR